MEVDQSHVNLFYTSVNLLKETMWTQFQNYSIETAKMKNNESLEYPRYMVMSPKCCTAIKWRLNFCNCQI